MLITTSNNQLYIYKSLINEFATMNCLKELIHDYRSSCTVPKHPKKCPDCGSKVSIFHMNYSEAVFLCSNVDCIWPLATHKPEDIVGKSDVTKFMRIVVEKRKVKAAAPSDNGSASDNSLNVAKSGYKTSPSKGNLIQLSSKSSENLLEIVTIPKVVSEDSLKSPVQKTTIPEEYNVYSTPPRHDEEDPPPSSMLDMPRMLSPIAPSPARHPKTPERKGGGAMRDEEEFVRPLSFIGTPRRMGTHHYFDVPKMLSPLPGTPYRSRDSERSVNIEDDFALTDSEMSDIENTPRHQASHGFDMPKLIASPFQRPSKPTYSKDLSRLPYDNSEGNSSPMKIMLKRNDSNEWNVENNDVNHDAFDKNDEDVVLPDRPAQSGKQPMKLDKVVLNLKKSAGGNTWNVTEKKHGDACSGVMPAAHDHANLPPKEERRGRKSKAAPMKIQNVEAITSSCGENATIVQVTDPPTKLIDKVQPPPEQLRAVSLPKRSPKEVGKPKEVMPKKGIKTFSRRIKKISVPASSQVEEDPFATNWKEVAKMSSQAASAFKENDSFNEVSHLMKAATGVKDIDLNFVQQIQRKLSLKNVTRNGQVTFFVGQSKTSIDLPTEDTSMAVSDSNAPVKVMLSAQSDGIIGDVLKTKEPMPQLNVEPKKKGRPPKSARPHSPPPTMVPQPEPSVPRHFGRSMPTLPESLPAGSISGQGGFDEILANPVAIQKFKYNLSKLMEGYELPPEWAAYNIDPFVAMMVTRSQDVAYSSINFEAMLQLYAKLVNYEWVMQNAAYHQSAPSAPVTSGFDLPAAARSSIDHPSAASTTAGSSRTYAELQTVRGGSQVRDATQVLRQHQQESAEQQRQQQLPASESHNPREKRNLTGRPVLKQEPVTPLQFGQPGSIDLVSVHPAPPSVSVVPNHMANQMQGKDGKIGKGDKNVQFTYRNSQFGPIYVSTEEEVKAIVALTESKIQEREYRDEHGGRRCSGVYASTAATRARSILSPDIICYLDRAFTKRGMKENIVGRKRRNYPKRSAIIKQDRVTGQLYCPTKNVLLGPEEIKQEIVPFEEVPPTEQPERRLQSDVDISTERGEETHPPPAEVLDEEETRIVGKISTSLFRGRRRKILTNRKGEAAASNATTNLPFSPKSSSNVSTASITGRKREASSRDTSDLPLKFSAITYASTAKARKLATEKATTQEIIDQMLAKGFQPEAPCEPENSLNVTVTPPKLAHGINTRRNTFDSIKKNLAPKQTAKRYFNPQTLMEQPNGEKELFIRREQEVKVKKFLEKKRKKEEKQHQRKLKRLQKTATTQYMGMGQTPQEAPKAPRRFTTAQSIGGRKMILKENGQVVQMAEDEAQPPVPPGPKPGQVSQAELDLIYELIRNGESAIDVTSAVPPPPPPSSQLNFTPIQSTRHQMPEFDFSTDGFANEKDFSFDDIF